MVDLRNTQRLDDTQRMLRDSVAAFTERESPIERGRKTREEGGVDRDAWQQMAHNGWLGLLYPEAKGGMGLGLAEAAVMFEELGRTLVPEPLAASSVLAGGVLAACDEDAFQGQMLPSVIDGRCLVALAWQEAANVYDVDAIAATADNNGLLTGTKRFVVAAHAADAFLVTANGSEGLGLYWVANDAAGLTISTDETIDGNSLGTLVMSGAESSARLCASDALALVNRALEEARLCAAAELVGVMSSALSITLDYVKQREQFGQPIGKFQALQHRLVDLWIQTELSRSSVIRAVQVFDQTADSARRAEAVSAAKARCASAASLVTRQSIQLHGGIGYTEACDIGLFLKRAVALSSWLGNASMHRRRYARIAVLSANSRSNDHE